MDSRRWKFLSPLSLVCVAVAITGVRSQGVDAADGGGGGGCEEAYGFLPCSSNVWGMLFMILVYEILLSMAGRYIARGSELFFRLIGPGIFGSSLFQMLSTIPQIVLVLMGSFTVSKEAAVQQAVNSVGLVVGSTVMLLTLVWGISVIVGSYNLAEAISSDDSTETQGLHDYGIVTDAETCFTARLVLVSIVPVIFLVPAAAIPSLVVQRSVILIALIITLVLLIGYLFYEIFEPWVHERRFEFLIRKYTHNRLRTLLSTNGRPDVNKIQRLFDSLDGDKSGSVSAKELRVLLLGVKASDGLNTEKDIEDIMELFDTSNDGRIDRNEFVRTMTKLVSDLWETSPIDRHSRKSQTGELQQHLLSTGKNQEKRSHVLLQYCRALFLVISGTVVIMLLATPLGTTVSQFAQAAHLPAFLVSYFAIPLAVNYGMASQFIVSATQRSRKSISLTLSSLYGTVYITNIVGLVSFLVPVYVRDLPVNAIAEAAVALVVCLVMSCVTSFYTRFPRWVGYLVLLFYFISLALIYLLTSVLHFP